MCHYGSFHLGSPRGQPRWGLWSDPQGWQPAPLTCYWTCQSRHLDRPQISKGMATLLGNIKGWWGHFIDKWAIKFGLWNDITGSHHKASPFGQSALNAEFSKLLQHLAKAAPSQRNFKGQDWHCWLVSNSNSWNGWKWVSILETAVDEIHQQLALKFWNSIAPFSNVG